MFEPWPEDDLSGVRECDCDGCGRRPRKVVLDYKKMYDDKTTCMLKNGSNYVEVSEHENVVIGKYTTSDNEAVLHICLKDLPSPKNIQEISCTIQNFVQEHPFVILHVQHDSTEPMTFPSFRHFQKVKECLKEFPVQSKKKICFCVQPHQINSLTRFGINIFNKIVKRPVVLGASVMELNSKLEDLKR